MYLLPDRCTLASSSTLPRCAGSRRKHSKNTLRSCMKATTASRELSVHHEVDNNHEANAQVGHGVRHQLRVPLTYTITARR